VCFIESDQFVEGLPTMGRASKDTQHHDKQTKRLILLNKFIA
jgi:hypothetical protein